MCIRDRTYSVQDLLEATLVASSNSAAIALAEKVAGSEPNFVAQMRAQLSRWGITSGKILNASGLPNEVLKDHRYPCLLYTSLKYIAHFVVRAKTKSKKLLQGIMFLSVMNVWLCHKKLLKKSWQKKC